MKSLCPQDPRCHAFLLTSCRLCGERFLASFENSMLLSQQERDAVADDVEVASRFYCDPALEADQEMYARVS